MGAEPQKPAGLEIAEGDILCDRYRADRLLAFGGMGSVVSATDMVRSETVAIKMIQPESDDGGVLLARLRREADILARMTSVHVVRVLDVAMHQQTLCLIMELLKGSDMARFVRKRGPLPIEEAVGYIIQACDGLADAHSQGVVHRDVKPSNVFLAERRDGTSIVKVLDFGVSKQYSVSGGAGLTVGGEMLGSPPYSSPEQLRDPSSVDGRADVWSIGLVLYYLLTGQNAFDADTFPALLLKIVTQPPPSLRGHRPDVPEELEAIFLKCIEKEPEDRYQDIPSLARSLTPFAPDWSESFLPGIDARAAGRGSLPSLPLIPMADLPEIILPPEVAKAPPPNGQGTTTAKAASRSSKPPAVAPKPQSAPRAEEKPQPPAKQQAAEPQKPQTKAPEGQKRAAPSAATAPAKQPVSAPAKKRKAAQWTKTDAFISALTIVLVGVLVPLVIGVIIFGMLRLMGRL